MAAQTFRATRTNNRRYPGVRGRRPDRYEERCEGADERRKECAERTPTQQIMRLDAKLGRGIGAKKERKRLLAPPAKVVEKRK